MAALRTLTISAALALTLAACAQNPADHAVHHPAGTAPAGMADRMATMDKHMQSMREMHDRMARARTAEERQALMAEHMKLMQEGMQMMGGMGGMGMGMAGGMGRMGAASAPAGSRAHLQMMEKRMEMMQSMMQMMMDRMQATPPAAK